MEVDEKLIDPNPRQPRKAPSDAADARLGESVKKHGVLIPLLVSRNGSRFILIAGQRRLRVARKNGLQKVPVRVLEVDEMTAARIAVIENELREKLNPMDLAESLQETMEAEGLNGAEVAAHMQMEPYEVSRVLPLLKLPPEVQAMIREGRISQAKAYELTKVDDPALQMQLAGWAVAGATRDEIVGAVKRSRRGTQASEPLKRVTAKLDADRAVTVQGSIASLDDFIATLADLLAAARKARTQGVEVGTFVKMLADKAKQPA